MVYYPNLILRSIYFHLTFLEFIRYKVDFRSNNKYSFTIYIFKRIVVNQTVPFSPVLRIRIRWNSLDPDPQKYADSKYDSSNFSIK